MKYKDLNIRAYTYRWIIIDEADGRFMQCGRCRAEAPLEKFSNTQGTLVLCELCAKTTSKDDVHQALNIAMRIAGVFDDYDVETPDEAGLREYWDSE